MNNYAIKFMSIHLEDMHHVTYWTKRFNVMATQLRDAVKAVGTNAFEVEVYLNNTYVRNN